MDTRTGGGSMREEKDPPWPGGVFAGSFASRAELDAARQQLGAYLVLLKEWQANAAPRQRMRTEGVGRVLFAPSNLGTQRAGGSAKDVRAGTAERRGFPPPSIN